MDLKQRVTLAGDEMCVYLDGIAVDKPIDIFESFGMGRGGGWGGASPAGFNGSSGALRKKGWMIWLIDVNR